MIDKLIDWMLDFMMLIFRFIVQYFIVDVDGDWLEIDIMLWGEVDFIVNGCLIVYLVVVFGVVEVFWVFEMIVEDFEVQWYVGYDWCLV